MNLEQIADEALKLAASADYLSYDTETSGVNWKENVPIGYVLAEGGTSFYVPIRHGGGGNLNDPTGATAPLTAAKSKVVTPHPFEVELAKIMEMRARLGRPVVGHNLKFDCHFSANAGIFLRRNTICTMNNEALLDEYSKSFSLDALAKKYGVTQKQGDALYRHLAGLFGGPEGKEQMANFWQTSGTDPMVYDYAAGDGVSTWQVFMAQKGEIFQQGLEKVWAVECELIWTLFRMERRGIKVDTDYLTQLLGDLDKYVQEALDVLPPGFNPRSPIQVKEYVSQFRTDWPHTDKGAPSFPEKWLNSFEQGRQIVNLRKWTNLGNTFVLPLRDEHSFNGRVHASLNQNKSDDRGTISGRLSCSGPNLQQVPKHDKERAKLIREAFTADEGYVFHEADYSQCEPRLFAHYSEEPALVNGYRADPPRDVHTVVAELFDADRSTTAKRMNMGMFTGMFPKSFAGHMGLNISEATELWHKWFEEFPRIKDFQDSAKKVMLNRGYVRTILGRRGRMESSRFAYKATSKIIQGGNADIMKHKLVEMDKYCESVGDRSQLLMSVHDSVVFQTPIGVAADLGEKDKDELLRIMADVQGDPFNLIVPFAVDIGSGANWKEASFGSG